MVNRSIENTYDGCLDKCEQLFGGSWTGLIIPDLDFLFYLDTIPRAAHFLLRTCRPESNGNHIWQDRYKTETFNKDDQCELWKPNDPDNGHKSGTIYKTEKRYNRNINTTFEHCTIADYTDSLEFYLVCIQMKLKKLEAKFELSNPNRSLIIKLSKKLPEIDYKIIYGYKNCFNDLILEFPEGNAKIIYRSFNSADYA
ncbi:hypothetical protein SNEBB_003924 [Seison nebaliae]|nr:hypothetical protein SNEBB_003924 [Seison nebaliae]